MCDSSASLHFTKFSKFSVEDVKNDGDTLFWLTEHDTYVLTFWPETETMYNYTLPV